MIFIFSLPLAIFAKSTSQPLQSTVKPQPTPNPKTSAVPVQSGRKGKALDLKTTLQYITEGIGTNPKALNLSHSLRGRAMEYLKANSTRIGSVVNSHDFEPASCGFIGKSHLTPHFLQVPMDDAIKHVQSQIKPKQKRRLYRRTRLFKRKWQDDANDWLEDNIARPFDDDVIKPTKKAFEHTIPDQLNKHVVKPVDDQVIQPTGNFFEHTVPDAFNEFGRDLKKGWKDFTNAFKSPENFEKALEELGKLSVEAWKSFEDYIKEYQDELIITAALVAVALSTAVVITMAPEFAPFLTEFAVQSGAEIGTGAAAEGAAIGAGAEGAATGASTALETTQQIFGNARKIYDAIDDIRGNVQDAVDTAQPNDQEK